MNCIFFYFSCEMYLLMANESLERRVEGVVVRVERLEVGSQRLEVREYLF